MCVNEITKDVHLNPMLLYTVSSPVCPPCPCSSPLSQSDCRWSWSGPVPGGPMAGPGGTPGGAAPC